MNAAAQRFLRGLMFCFALGVLVAGASGCFYVAGAAAAVVVATSDKGGGSSGGNALPIATVEQPARSVNGELELRFELRDDDADRVQVVVEYRAAGSASFATATPAASSPSTDDLEATAAGVEHTFVWDYAVDLGDGAQTVLIRITPLNAKGNGAADTTAELVVGNNAPELEIVSPTPAVTASTTFAGSFSFEYELSDSSSDPVTLTAEFSVDGTTFLPATTLSSLTSSLLPGRHSFVWTSTDDLDSATYEGNVDFRLRPSDAYEDGEAVIVTLSLDNNQTPRVNNLFDAAADRVSPLVVPFMVSDMESDTVEVFIQWSVQPQASFPDLDDPALNPFVNPADARYLGDSVEDPAVRAAVLADSAVQSALGLISEARAELRATAGVTSTLSRLVAPSLNRLRPSIDLDGATVIVGFEGDQTTVTGSMDGLDIELSPPLAAGPVAGVPVCVKIAAVQGRGLQASTEGTLYTALWNCAADLPADRTVAIRITAFDSQAGPAAESVRVDRRVRGDLVVSEVAAVEDGPQALAAGDLDGDGRDDLAVANAYGGSVTVLYSGSLGLLENGSELQLDPLGHPEAIAIGDLNDDGQNDIAVASPAEGTAVVFLQNPAGNLPAVPASLTVGAEPGALALGDLNDDGLDDLVIASGPGAELAIFLQAPGTGLPSTASTTFSVDEVPEAMLIADLDADGLMDLAAANPAAGTVTVHLQADDNTLPATPSLTLASGDEPVSLAVGELNDDGRADLVVANHAGDTLTVFVQSAGGGFGAPATLPAGEGPVSVALADVNDDGLDDILAANQDDFTLMVFLRQVSGLPESPSAIIAAGEFPRAIVLADLGGDGDTDVVVATQGELGDASVDSIVVYVSDPPGRLSDEPEETLTGSFGPEGMEIADVDGDGRADLTVVTSLDTIAVYHQDPVGALPETPSLTINAGEGLDAVTVGDLNGDGRNDIVVDLEDEVLVYLQGVDGALGESPPLTLTGAPAPEELAIGDLNGDGRSDLVVAGDEEDLVYIYLQDSQGALALTPSSSHATGNGPDSLAIADLNSDGRDDLVVTNSDDTVSVFLQTGAGALPGAPSLTLSTDTRPQEGAVGDLNADGLIDVAVLNVPDSTVEIFLNDALAGLATTASLSLSPGAGSESFAIGDLNGDGRDDLVVTNIDSGEAAIYIQDVDGLTPDPNQELDAGFSPDAQALGDLNGDGRNDLAVSNDGELGVPADDVIRIYLQE